MKPLLRLLLLVLISSSAMARQPNVVVFLTDDQGWGDLSLNGNTNLSTPNIDSLAKDFDGSAKDVFGKKNFVDGKQ